MTQDKNPCQMCFRVSETNARYECGHFRCLECYDLLRESGVNKCPYCNASLELMWVDGMCQIFIKGMDGSNITLAVDSDRTTGDGLHNMIYRILDRPYGTVRLLFSGKQIQSGEKTMRDYKIFQESPINEVARLRGD